MRTFFPQSNTGHKNTASIFFDTIDLAQCTVLNFLHHRGACFNCTCNQMCSTIRPAKAYSQPPIQRFDRPLRDFDGRANKWKIEPTIYSGGHSYVFPVGVLKIKACVSAAKLNRRIGSNNCTCHRIDSSRQSRCGNRFPFRCRRRGCFYLILLYPPYSPVTQTPFSLSCFATGKRVYILRPPGHHVITCRLSTIALQRQLGRSEVSRQKNE